MLNIFKKRNNETKQLFKNDEHIFGMLSDHMKEIGDLQNRVDGLLDNIGDIKEIVLEQQKAMRQLEESIEELKKLTNKN